MAGVQSEMELAFAGLHQLCAPMLEHLEHMDRLPVPQRDALRIAFGVSSRRQLRTAMAHPGQQGSRFPAPLPSDKLTSS